MRIQSPAASTLALLVLILLTGALLGCQSLFRLTSVDKQESKKVQRWEYCLMSPPYPTPYGWKVNIYLGGKDETIDSDMSSVAALNKLGADGWELVGVSDEVVNQGNQTFTKFLLKRSIASALPDKSTQQAHLQEFFEH